MSNLYQPKITREQLNQLPLKAFEGNIIIIDTIDDAEKCSNLLMKEKILGFDTETKPSFKKGKNNKVALLQLSTSRNAYLFRINLIGLPKSIVNILNNDNILKVGVAIKDDIKALRQFKNFSSKGFIELQTFVKNYNIENFGLKKLCGIVLNFRISKSQQLSNWEENNLSEAQKKYAATDAWTSLEIYKKLIKSH